MKKTILVVDDQINTLKVIGAILEDEGYKVLRSATGAEALDLLTSQEPVDAVLADLRMPGMGGLELYHRMAALKIDIPFIIMTAYGTVESAVKAMKEGVTHYLIKPLNYDELGLVLERAIHIKRISEELYNLRLEVKGKNAFQEIIGAHPSMRQIFDLMRTVAPTDAPVLIHGETGTGKELLAKALHTLSRRSDRPMVCINSAALSESLLEAELFGYVKGAFTGAVANKAGRLEAADGGTLFLDEIGHMSLKLQTKLLRFLQEGSFEPVGGNHTHYVDVRVIAATNMDLNAEIKAKRFLSDVLYRIEVISITVPPLRERGDDTILLADHFIKHYTKTYQRSIDAISPEAMARLMKYAWPGNVRELENVIARSVILAKSEQIQECDLPEKLRGDFQELESSHPDGYIRELPDAGIALRDLERELIRKTLGKCLGNKKRTAEMLGMSRKTLYEKIERYNLT